MNIEDLHVLLAETSSQSVAAIRRALRGMGFSQITIASTGYVVLTTLKKSAVDLMILEKNLPGMDALRIVEEIGKIPRFNRPKIILMTTDARRKAIEYAAELGIDEYLVKPLSNKQLKEKIEHALEISIH